MNNTNCLCGRPILLTVFFTLLTLINIVFMESVALFAVTLPEYLLVLYYILKNKFQKALYWHIVFTVVCVNAGTVILEGSLSYAKIKLVGPLTLNYILLAIMWLSVRHLPIRVDKKSLLLKSRNLFEFFIVFGGLVGCIGFVVDDNYMIIYFINILLYVVIAFLYADMLIRLYNEKMSKLFAVSTLCMITASTVAVLLSFFVFGMTTMYSVDESFINNPIYYTSPCLLIAFFQVKDLRLKLISLIGIIFYGMGSVIISRGSTFLATFVAISLLIYMVYFKSKKTQGSIIVKIILPAILIIGIPLVLGVVISSGTVSNNKFEQFTSLFRLFDFSASLPSRLAEVGNSPYIRIAEVLDVIDNGLNNIITFVIGSGYGGYYTDSLNLFSGMDLSNGAFPEEMVKVGRFYKGHSVYPTALLYNGLIGLVLLLRIGLMYLRNIDKTFLVFSGFMLFMYGFYFDPVALVSNIMALFGAEYMINNKGHEESIC